MSNQSLAEKVRSSIRNLSSDARELRRKVKLSDIRDEIEDLQNDVEGMPQRIKSLRERGYVFEANLENQAESFIERWEGIAPALQEQLSREARTLERIFRPLDKKITELAGQSGAPAALLPRANRLKSEVKSMKNRVKASEKSLRGGYDSFQDDVQKITEHLSEVEWMLNEFSEAKFDLLATEGAIMAVKAVWAKDGEERKNDPEGVLYLTDQRLLFEQKEKIVTKKVLFVPTKKELVQKLLWEAPVALIEEIKARKEGFLKKDDLIEVHFGGGAPFRKVYLHIWQSGDVWQVLLRRAKAKEFDRSRAVAIDKTEARKVKNAPTECPSCGATINQVVLRGMDRITCEYCGAVIRL